jgi:hypothetical protein
MITVYIEPNTIAPFVDNVAGSTNLINFEVKSRYYVPYSNLSVDDIFNNEYYDTYETNNIKDKKALQITTRITQIKPVVDDIVSYGFSIKLSPEINEIKYPASKFFTNLREQENFNSFVNNYKPLSVSELEERIFTDFEILAHNADDWDDNYKKNYQIIKRLLENNSNKKTSIQNLTDASIRGLNDDFKMMYPGDYQQGPFNEIFDGYCLPVIYNEEHQYWESISSLNILNNYWEKILINFEDQTVYYSFFSRLLYPIITNNDIHNFYFGAYLEPFRIRDVFQWRVRTKNISSGIKFSFVEAGINARGVTNVVTDIISATANLKNAYLDTAEIFSDVVTINLETTSHEYQRKSVDTGTIFNRNGSLTNDNQLILKKLDNTNQYPIWTTDNTMTFNFFNSEEDFDPIKPFNDNNIIQNYIDNFSIYNDISDEDKTLITQTLLDNLNKRGVIDNNLQYSTAGYDVSRLTNPTGRDSKIYIDLKE